MYNHTVTIFNYFEDDDGAYWYPKVLTGVDLNTDRAALLKKYGAETTDNAELHVKCTRSGDTVLVGSYVWYAPKAWKKSNKPASLTFNPDTDFFWYGAWENGTVDDSDYDRQGGFYQYMNKNEDGIYKVTSASAPYTIIPHFEILGK